VLKGCVAAVGGLGKNYGKVGVYTQAATSRFLVIRLTDGSAQSFTCLLNMVFRKLCARSTPVVCYFSYFSTTLTNTKSNLLNT
jgi:hypothetical protein